MRKTPEEIRQEREFRASRASGKPHSVCQTRKVAKNVITVDETVPGRVYILPGTWPAMKRAFDSDMAQYDIEDKRNMAIRPELDQSAFDGVEFRKNQDVAIALIAASDCGIIATATAFGKSFILSILCKAYPTLRIVVTTGSVQVVKTLYEYLQKTIPGEVGLLCGTSKQIAGKRVIVSTLASLGNIPGERVDLVLVDECHAIGDGKFAHLLTNFAFARRFGFTASPIRNDGSYKVMEALLGPVILKMDYEEAVDAKMVTPIKYLMLPCSQCPNVARSPNLPELLLKRWSYWRNSYRSRAIKQFVTDLHKVYDGQILIMVSTLEAALELSMQLPWFTVAYYGKVDVAAMAKKFPKDRYPNLDWSKYKVTAKRLEIMRQAFAKGTLRYVISTKVFRAGVNFVHLRVLIRADGDISGVDGIQIPGRLARLDEGKTCAYLVDVADTFSDWARSRANARESLYSKQGWEKVQYQEVIDDLGRKPEEHDEQGTGEPGEA